jgi:peptidoglycan hydrolase-like protein with peptidoglycan-binding domain
MKSLICIVATLCTAGVLHADQTIRSLQQVLKDKGLYYGTVTGEKSAETSAAIRRYQIRSGLKVTGALNEETSRSLGTSTQSVAAANQSSTNTGVTGPAGVPPNASSFVRHNSPLSSSGQSNDSGSNPSYVASFYQVPPRAANRRAIAEAQYQLTSRGYYRGRIDCAYGSRTASAVRAFQSSAGLPPTGRLDTQTVNALGSSNADVANFTPVSRHNETWMPVTKFKHGRWKVKWKRYHRPSLDEPAGDSQQANSEYSWNGYNEN